MQHHETSYADDNMDFQMKDDNESLSNEGNNDQYIDQEVDPKDMNHIETEYAQMEDAAEEQPEASKGLNLNSKSPSKGDQKQLQSKTLRWYMPIIGEVPMSK